MYDYSVVVPVFNSEYTLVKLFESLIKVFEELDKTVQCIFVDDGPSVQAYDVAWDIWRQLSRQVIMQGLVLLEHIYM